MSKMMLKKEWSCILFEIVSWNQFVPLFASHSNGVNVLLQSREEAPETISSAPRRGMNPNCLPQKPPIRMDMNPTKI
jgi:hypothetical protein